jgi:DNA repair protein RadD
MALAGVAANSSPASSSVPPMTAPPSSPPATRSWRVVSTGAHGWSSAAASLTHHVGQELRARGVSCRVVTGETPLAEREDSVAAFKAGALKCLVNVNVLTTGFDAPRIDLLAMLRPTLSTGLYVQMVGRGTRKADGKVNCLILDFAGNCRRHGPVDQVDINVGSKSEAAVTPTSVRAKTCPECAEVNPLDAAACCCCGHEWPKPKPAAKHATSADAVPILTGERVWLPSGGRDRGRAQRKILECHRSPRPAPGWRRHRG